MLTFLDGASHYATAQLSGKYSAVDSGDCVFSVAPGEGRLGGAIKRVSTTQSTTQGFLTITPQWVQTGLWSAQSGGVYGCAFKVDQFQQIGAPYQPTVGDIEGTYLSIYSGAQCVLAVALNPNGTFSLLRERLVGFGGAVNLGTTVGGIGEALYNYVEMKWVLDQVNGYFEIRINSNPVLVFNGRTMPNAADLFPFAVPPSTWSSINVLGVTSNPSPNLLTIRHCDVYLFDLVASADPANPNNDFIGDIPVKFIRPDGVGAQSNWSPSAAPNWSCVDEVPPNGDTDYVETVAAGTRDTYTFEDVPDTPRAIQVCSFARKIGVGAASLAAITRQGGVDFDGPSQGIGSTSFDYLLQPYDVNPATNLRFTQAEMNAGEWGPLKSV